MQSEHVCEVEGVNQIPLDYAELEKEVMGLLGQTRFLVLATASGNRVTARTMSIVNEGLGIYFQTEACMDKCMQMAENPCVALCFENVQIEGIAQSKGCVCDEGNQLLRDRYCEHHRRSFERYCHLDGQVFVEVRPTRVTLWKYLGSKPCRDFLFVDERRAVRVYYHPEASA